MDGKGKQISWFSSQPWNQEEEKNIFACHDTFSVLFWISWDFSQIFSATETRGKKVNISETLRAKGFCLFCSIHEPRCSFLSSLLWHSLLEVSEWLSQAECLRKVMVSLHVSRSFWPNPFLTLPDNWLTARVLNKFNMPLEGLWSVFSTDLLQLQLLWKCLEYSNIACPRQR